MLVWIRGLLRINVHTSSNEEKMINCIKKQKLKVVMKMLNYYDINVNYVDATGNTALTLAAQKGYLEIVNVLLAKNANINYSDDQFSGYTALMSAVANNHFAVVTTLLKNNANVNHVAINGMNALILSIKNDYLDIANVLLTKNVNINHENWFGYTALIWAARKGNLGIVNVLLAKNDNVNYANEHHNTALIWASEIGYLGIVNVLIAHNANINYITNNDGTSALLVATQNDHLAIVKTLLASGADVNHIAVNTMSALLLATWKGNLEIVKVLLASGANVNHFNEDGDTALLVATQNGYLEIVNALLVNGANVNHKNHNGDTALIVAVINHYTEIKILINQVIQLEKENLLNFKKMINKFNSMLEEINTISSKKVERNFIKILQYYEFYNNNKNKNIDCELINFFKKKFINGLRFGQENHTILHITILNKWHKLVTYLMNNWPIDIELNDKTGNTAWHYACLLLQSKNTLMIKKTNQLTDEDRFFLEDSINLSSRKNLFLLKNRKDLVTSKRRLNIINGIDEIGKDALEYFKTEINSESSYSKVASSTSNINNHQIL